MAIFSDRRLMFSFQMAFELLYINLSKIMVNYSVERDLKKLQKYEKYYS